MPKAKPKIDPLKAYREEHGLTQQQLADKLTTKEHPVSRALVSMWETDGRDIQAEDAVLIEKKLGIPREETRPDLFKRQAA